jgi:ribosomal protein S18 acetylase RimI-like enzyme
MVQFVQFDPTKHYNDYHLLLLEHRLNTTNRLKENHQLDAVEIFGQIPELVENQMKTHVTFKPPEEVILLIYVDGEVAGMGRISKVRNDAGEIKQMYNRPKFRGRGYAKAMLKKLMEKGRELGYTTFLLDVWKLGHPARHIYSSAGFKEIERYPENKLPSFMEPYYVFMEKQL